MTNTQKIGIGVFITLLFYKVLRGIKALKIRLKTYEIRNIDLLAGKVTMNLYFEITNPLLVGITLREISGRLIANSGSGDEVVGEVSNKYHYFIRGNATHIIKAPIAIDTQNTLAAFIQNIQSGDVDNLLISFDGKFVFGDQYEVPIYIKRTMTISELTSK